MSKNQMGDVRVTCPCCGNGMIEVTFYRNQDGQLEINDFWSDECNCGDFLTRDWDRWEEIITEHAYKALP